MRTTISLDDNVAALAEKIAAKESRNFSNLCEVALKEYCGPRDADGLAELGAAAEEVGGIDAALAALRKLAEEQHTTRKRRKAA